MPLIRDIPFSRKKVPKDIESNVPIYYIEQTGEAFTVYEEFCYRTLQCNSLLWTCAETGRTDLTFSEALESERDAKKILSCFPEESKVPALYLASVAQSSDFQELVLDVLNFMEKHYFVNEFVTPITKAKWKLGKVLRVKNPKGASLQSTRYKSMKNLQHYIPPAWYEYTISANVGGKGIETTLSGSKLKRPDDTCLTKDTLSAFLRQNAVLNARGIWVIKGSVLQQYAIQFVKFCDIFCGDPPVFPRIQQKQKNKKPRENSVTRPENKLVPPNGTKDDKVTSEERKIKKQDHPRPNEDVGKQNGQQTIERFFSPSKRPSPVQDGQDEMDSDEDLVNYVEAEIKKEPPSPPRSPASILEIVSEEESGSSGDELKVVWASTVKPNRYAMKKLFEKMGKVVVDLGQGPVEIKRELNKTLDSTSSEENESFKKGSQKRRLSVNLETVQKGLIPPRKKLKQTRMFESQSSIHTDKSKKLSFTTPHKKSQKHDSAKDRRKQKIVGTLKPWMQTTQKQKGSLSAAAASSTTKAHKSSASQTLKEKKKNWLEVQREIELREKEKKQEERQRKKARLEEEKLKFAKFMKEWRKHREDLLCEDLKPLPVPCEINCRIPNELFGDFMMVLEFLHSYSAILKVKVTGGVTFEFLERALVEKDIAGPLNDIIKGLLTTVFDLQVIEHEKPKSGVPIAVELNLDDLYDEDVTPPEAISQPITATGWCNVFRGVSLLDIPITSNTVSEILRLHLLGSGGRAWECTSKWLTYRGGYSNQDDPGLWFAKEKSLILFNLSQNHVSELAIEEKLDILCCLVNQLLTYASVRDKVEERCEQARQARAGVRSLQVAEIKLQKEASAKRIQEKKNAKLSLTKGVPRPSADESLYEKQRMEKEMNKLKVELQKKSTKVLPLAMSGQLLPLGSDRAHRKYWLFSSLPGLFVEYNPFEIGPCLPQPTPQAPDLSDTLTHVRRLFEEEGHNSSDKENDSSDPDVSKPVNASSKKMLGEQNNVVETLNYGKENEKNDSVIHTENVNEGELLLCSASDSCPVHCPRESKSHWYFFPKGDDVTALLGSLNDRGIRESALLRVLKHEEQRIVETVQQCPAYKLNPSKFQISEGEQRKSTRHGSGYKESVKSKFPSDTPASGVMEWTLRECILDLETRITVGGVGSLKVDDRMMWRTAIETGLYDKQCEKLVWGFRMRMKETKENDHSEKTLSEDDPSSSLSSTQSLTVIYEGPAITPITKRIVIKDEKIDEYEGSDQGEERLSDDDPSSSQSSSESITVIYDGLATTPITKRIVIKEENVDEYEDEKKTQSSDNPSSTMNKRQVEMEEETTRKANKEPIDGVGMDNDDGANNNKEEKKNQISKDSSSAASESLLEVEKETTQNANKEHIDGVGMDNDDGANNNKEEKKNQIGKDTSPTVSEILFEMEKKSTRNINKEHIDGVGMDNDDGANNNEEEKKNQIGKDKSPTISEILFELEKERTRNANKEHIDGVRMDNDDGANNNEDERENLRRSDFSSPKEKDSSSSRESSLMVNSVLNELETETTQNGNKEKTVDDDGFGVDIEAGCSGGEMIEQEKSEPLVQDCGARERVDQDAENVCNLDDDSSCSEDIESKSLDKDSSVHGISTLTNIPPLQNPVVKDLASAILQLGQSVDPRCLKKPLADDCGRMVSHMKYWEISLMNTTNFSQLFIHHSTLENSINWATSAYNSPCVVCDRRKYGKKMILCDGCNKRFHIYCTKPKLKSVPEGPWKCQNCTPKESETILENNENASSKSTRSTAGAERKRKAGADSVDEDEDGDDTDERHSKIRKANEYDTCRKCAQTGDLIYCTTCSMGYHSECTNSSRLDQQKKWLCESCKTEAQLNTSEDEEFQRILDIKMDSVTQREDETSEDSIVKNTREISDESSDASENETPKQRGIKRRDKSTNQSSESSSEYDDISRERRGCASAARAKIACFTKRLRSPSWEDDNDAFEASGVEDSPVRRSSRRSMFASEDLPLDNAILQDLVKDLIQHEFSWPFLRPVRKSQVPDYHKKIKRPMDLGTIKFRLNTAVYKTNRDFVKDVVILFENCFMYNEAHTIEYQSGLKLLNFFEKRSSELGLNWKLPVSARF